MRVGSSLGERERGERERVGSRKEEAGGFFEWLRVGRSRPTFHVRTRRRKWAREGMRDRDYMIYGARR